MRHLARGEIPPNLVKKVMDHAISGFIKTTCSFVVDNRLPIKIIEKELGKGNGFIKKILGGEKLGNIDLFKLSGVFLGFVTDTANKIDRLRRNEDKKLTDLEKKRQITYNMDELKRLVNAFFNIFKNFFLSLAHYDFLRDMFIDNLKELIASLEEKNKT